MMEIIKKSTIRFIGLALILLGLFSIWYDFSHFTFSHNHHLPNKLVSRVIPTFAAGIVILGFFALKRGFFSTSEATSFIKDSRILPREDNATATEQK